MCEQKTKYVSTQRELKSKQEKLNKKQNKTKQKQARGNRELMIMSEIWESMRSLRAVEKF